MLHHLRVAHRMIVTELGQLSIEEWTIFGAVLVTVGFMCMRGYGSRKHY